MPGHWQIILKATAAFLLAGGIAWLELVTSKYPRTYLLFGRKSWALWCYPFTYSAVSALFVLLHQPLMNAGLLNFQTPPREIDSANSSADSSKRTPIPSAKPLRGAEVASPSWLMVVMIGVSAKAFMHIRLFSVTSGRQTTPFGVETLVYLYEPWLLRTILLDEDNAVQDYLRKKYLSYSDLIDVKNRVKTAIPGTLPEDERKALARDVEEADLAGAMELFLRSFGVKTFERVFPDLAPSKAKRSKNQTT